MLEKAVQFSWLRLSVSTRTGSKRDFPEQKKKNFLSHLQTEETNPSEFLFVITSPFINGSLPNSSWTFGHVRRSMVSSSAGLSKDAQRLKSRRGKFYLETQYFYTGICINVSRVEGKTYTPEYGVLRDGVSRWAQQGVGHRKRPQPGQFSSQRG